MNSSGDMISNLIINVIIIIPCVVSFSLIKKKVYNKLSYIRFSLMKLIYDIICINPSNDNVRLDQVYAFEANQS